MRSCSPSASRSRVVRPSATSTQGAPSSASAVVAARAPYRAVLVLPSASPPTSLARFGRELQAEGDEYTLVCEFHTPEQFLSALLAAGLPARVLWPAWLRRQLLDRLGELQAVNERKPVEDVAGMTSGVTSPLVPSSRKSQARESFPQADGAHARRSPSADITTQSKATEARFEPNWTSYVGALRGVLRPAGLCELDTSQLMGLTGMAFHPIERVEYDPGEAYRRSLQYYVEHMERQANTESAHARASAYYRNGLSAYGNWIRALEGGTYIPMGLRYATSVYADAKSHAARYLAWLAESWGGLPNLREVASAMSENADVFARMLGVLEATHDGAHLGRPVSQAQAAALAPLVKQARQVEERTVALVRRSLEEARPQ